MADPLSITASVLAVGGFALKSSIALHRIIRGLHSQDRDARALKAEISDLTGVLSSLLDTISANPSLDFEYLKRPLQRCGNACEEYGKIVARCTKHSSTTSRSSVRDWVTQKYLQGDINDFRAMLAAHKSTINIALANANLRSAGKIDRLKAGDTTAVDDVAVEWQALLDEKASTQQGIDMCAQLSAQIVRAASASTEHTQFSGRPSAHKHINTGLNEAGKSIQSLVARLQTHEALISSQLEAMSLKDALTEPVAAQLARLQQTKDSVSQCIKIVSEAGEIANERSNVFEDLTLADNSYAFSVSTVNDLVTARRLNLEGRSRHFGGQVTNETVQKSVEALTKLDAEHIRSLNDAQFRHQALSTANSSTPEGHNSTKQFFDRFGPGVTLVAKNMDK
ncbi:hypothetical protein PG987_004904 [Apiospora arundinis]